MVNIQLCLWPTDVFVFKFRHLLSPPETLLHLFSLREIRSMPKTKRFNTFWGLEGNLKAVTMTLRSKGLFTEEIPLGYGTTEASPHSTELLLIT